MRRFVFSFILFFVLQLANAQKVALVLSGGGAKGLAHIGVIRALEENQIPIDYVAGTSMGAIVAGLYAAGYTPDQMEELFKSEQFKFWSTGIIQEEYRYYFSKLEDTPAWLRFDLEKKDDKLKLVLPTNIIPEEQMDFAFMELFSSINAACNYDFSQLLVPFFCVATDVYNNKEVILKSGDLGEAIRASMTFPLYFKPIEIEGTLVFDGGIVNNFPVQNALEIFQPDIVIGHKVANNANRPDEDDVMAQLENLIMQKTDYEIPPEKGLLIESSFEDIGLLDFDQIDAIKQTGYNQTQNLMDSLKLRIQRRVAPTEIDERRAAFVSQKPALRFQHIQVEGLHDPLQRKYLIQSLKHSTDTIGIEQLRKAYFKLVSNPQIKAIRPVSIYNPETGNFDLHLKVKPQKPLEIQFGGNVSSKPINQGFLSVDYRFFKNRAYTLSANTYFGRFYSSAKFGGRVDFPTRLPFYLSSYLTFNQWEYYSTENNFFFDDASTPALTDDENSLRFEAGFPLGTRGKLMFQSALGDRNIDYSLAGMILRDTKLDETKFRTFSGSIQFEENSLNYKQLATEGIQSKLGITVVQGTEEFSPGSLSDEEELHPANEQDHTFFVLNAAVDKYFRLSRRFSVGLNSEAVYSNKKLFSNYYSSVVTAQSFAPMPFSQTLMIERYRANRYIGGGAKSIVHLSDQFHFRVEAYGFLPFRKIVSDENFKAVYEDFSLKNSSFMGLGGLVYNTNAGPISLTLNYLENKNTKWYLVFSFGYVLFNKKGY